MADVENPSAAISTENMTKDVSVEKQIDSNNNEVSTENLKDSNNIEISGETPKDSTKDNEASEEGSEVIQTNKESVETNNDTNIIETELQKDDNANETETLKDTNHNEVENIKQFTNDTSELPNDSNDKAVKTDIPSSESTSESLKVPVAESKEEDKEAKEEKEPKKEEESLKPAEKKQSETSKEKSNDLLGNEFDSKWDHFPTSDEFRSLYGEEIWEQLQSSYSDLAKTLKEDITQLQDSTQPKKAKRLTCWDALEPSMDKEIESPKEKRPREMQTTSNENEEKRPTRVGRPPGKKNGEVRESRPAGKIPCHLCENSFDSIAQARAHLLIHSGIKPFKCTKCEYKSYSRFNVTNNHWSNRHDRKGDVNDVDVNETEKENMRTFVITETEKMLSGNAGARDEEPKKNEKTEPMENKREKVEAAPKPERKNKAKKEGPVKCHLCDKSFELVILAKGHLQVHSQIKPYKCSHCDYKSYSKNNVMNNHCSNHHGKKGNNDDVETDLNEKLNLKKFVIEESEKMLQSIESSKGESSKSTGKKEEETNNSDDEN